MTYDTQKSALQPLREAFAAPPTWRELILLGFLLLELFWVVNGHRPRTVVIVPDFVEPAGILT